MQQTASPYTEPSSEFLHRVTAREFSFLAMFITETLPPVQELLTFISRREVPGAGCGPRLARSRGWVLTLLAPGCSSTLVLQPWRSRVACTWQLGSSLVPAPLSGALAPAHLPVVGSPAAWRCPVCGHRLPAFLLFSHQEGVFMEYHFLVVPVGRKNDA